MLAEIVQKNWLGELAQRCTVGAMKLVGDEFRGQHDPYGDAWAPLKRERTRDRRARMRALRAGRTPRGSKVLHRTGRMENSIGATASGGLMRVLVPVEYAQYHQVGTIRMVQRKILPDTEGGGDPESWDLMIRKEAALLLAQKFGAR
jgi:hypothetical protein